VWRSRYLEETQRDCARVREKVRVQHATPPSSVVVRLVGAVLDTPPNGFIGR
jgi:hypothetical protein